jgi:anaerobic ribonucleoside-triphosphate reductase activating protein
MDLNVYKIIKNTNVEGPENRFCIWTQGCSKHCSGCYAKETWSFEPKQIIDTCKILEMIKQEKNLEGITFLGGEPFEQATPLSELAQSVQELGLSVVTFTGQIYEKLKTSNNKYILKLLQHTDLLIDGGFEQDKVDYSRPWVGSSNQRYIFLSGKYNEKMISSYKNKIELRVNEDGTIFANGMGNFEQLENTLGLIKISRSYDDV